MTIRNLLDYDWTVFFIYACIGGVVERMTGSFEMALGVVITIKLIHAIARGIARIPAPRCFRPMSEDEARSMF